MPKPNMDMVMVYPDLFHGFDAVPAACTGQIKGAGVPYTVSRRGITAELPVFTMLSKEQLYEDFDLSFTSGAFLPILESETPAAIQVYLEQAKDKWELFLARHQYKTPHYVPPQYKPASNPEKPDSKTEKQEGWLRKLFKHT